MNLRCIFHTIALGALLLSPIINSATSLVSSLSPLAQQFINEYPKKKIIIDSKKKSSVELYLNSYSKVMMQLKTALVKSAIQENIKNELIRKIDKMAEKRNILSNKYFDNNDYAINFLNIQMYDALIMLNSIQVAALQTADVLSKMKGLAVQAATGTYPPDQMKLFNLKFNAFKEILNYIQSVDIVNGEKKLSGGDFTLQIGDSSDVITVFKIAIPAFDREALSLSDLAIDTHEKAAHSIAVLEHDMKLVTQVVAALNPEIIADASAPFIIIPFVLNQDLALFDIMQDLILQATNGVWTDDDRALMNIELDTLKAMLKRVQSYVSLDGLKLLGGGSLHIQIGEHSAPETELTIPVPVTDVNSLGVNKLDIKTQANAYQALDAILQIKRDTVYSSRNFH